MDDITLKTGVNSRAPLADRVAKHKAPANQTGNGTTGPASAGCGCTSLHRLQETTYDIDYTEKRAPGGTNPFASHKCLSANATANAAARSWTPGGTGKGAFDNSAGASGTDGAAAPKSADGDASQQPQPTLAGSGRRPLISYRVTSGPTAEWESTYRASTRNVQPDQDLAFYSRARQIEKADDDMRGGRVGSVQRAVDIRNKRSTDPNLCPSEAHYNEMQRVEVPVIAAQEKGVVKRNYLDLVQCDHKNPNTEEEIGFHDAPLTRLPGGDLSQDLAVQSKAITHMGTSEQLFRGTPKFIDDKPVGYGGHIPSHDRNIASMHHDEDARRTYAKSFMTLAVHGGGVDASVGAKNLKARHRSGRNAPAAKILKPKSQDSIDKTVEGYMLKQPIYQTSDRERSMNIRDDAQAKSYF